MNTVLVTIQSVLSEPGHKSIEDGMTSKNSDGIVEVRMARWLWNLRHADLRTTLEHYSDSTAWFSPWLLQLKRTVSNLGDLGCERIPMPIVLVGCRTLDVFDVFDTKEDTLACLNESG